MRKHLPLGNSVCCIGVACALGTAQTGSASGPASLLSSTLFNTLRRHGIRYRATETINPHLACATPLFDLLARLAEATHSAIARGERPLVIGGDHAIAAGTWKGIARALGRMPGLIWIDAHLDAHVPATSPSGNLHGMPVAALLGEAVPEMSDIPGPKLDAARLVIVGAHSFEAEEHQLLKRYGVRIIGADEIAKFGLRAMLTQARKWLGDGAWGISLDVDAIDPGAAPGVNTPVAGGLDPAELTQALRSLLREQDCVGFEIAEYNPRNDPDGRTARLIHQLIDAASAPDAETLKRWEDGFGARNYAPLPVVLSEGQGCWLTDIDGRRYLDMMSAYSANSFGHAHPKLLAALNAQAGRLALTSRAYSNDRLPLFLRRLTEISGYARALPVNTGLEAVETALKAARKWAYKVKGVPPDQAEIIACDGNFHGRSIAIVGLSSEAQYRDGFGPYPAGLKTVPFGNVGALAAAMGPNTAAFLVEPIQGEGGVVVPPAGYLSACAKLCREHRVLLLVDEVQTGLGRTGKLFAFQHDAVRPDGIILGKALGGGLIPVSAFLADDELMGVFTPGDHGSTFGGYPLAAAVGLAALDLLEDEGLIAHSAMLGEHLLKRLQQLAEDTAAIRSVRGKGLFAGIELEPTLADAREMAERLLQRGILTKDTHATVLRLAPPLIIDQATLDWALDQIILEFAKNADSTRLCA
jgi:ornithine--oxo-acid transaminase